MVQRVTFEIGDRVSFLISANATRRRRHGLIRQELPSNSYLVELEEERGLEGGMLIGVHARDLRPEDPVLDMQQAARDLADRLLQDNPFGRVNLNADSAHTPPPATDTGGIINFIENHPSVDAFQQEYPNTPADVGEADGVNVPPYAPAHDMAGEAVRSGLWTSVSLAMSHSRSSGAIEPISFDAEPESDHLR